MRSPTRSTDVTVIEGNTGTTDAVFTVTLSQPSAQTVTVDYTTVDGTAIAGEDYVAQTGSVVFAPGDTTGTLTVEVMGDTLTEPEEYFTVSLDATASRPAATTAAAPTGGGVGRITDDDLPVPGDANRDGLGDVLLRQTTTGDVAVLISDGSAFTNEPWATGVTGNLRHLLCGRDG